MEDNFTEWLISRYASIDEEELKTCCTKEQKNAVNFLKQKLIEPFHNSSNLSSIELKNNDVKSLEIILDMLKEKYHI